MAQKTLNAFVVIGGRVDNTFGRIGTALVSMGSTIDEVSQKLINFGKESVEVYRDYQDSMLDAQVALSTTYGRGSQELASVMRTLDAQAKEWAASTIFHTDDVANAIAQAAHANWDLNMILDGIPAAMKLAQAGSMDLSEAVDFIIKSVNGAGLEFRDLNEWIDEWTYAANSSAGDVEEFGEAMLKMGNTMKFAGNKEELLTMLAILHDSGTTGAAAGTLLRNSMLRLIAPTKKASDALAQLGVTQDDIDEAMSEVDGDTEAAVKQLEELGFSVYDTNGDLKDFMTIFADLDKVTEGMSDEDKYAIWSAIFPTKTITGGMALMEAATESVNGLYAALDGGDAVGYGDYAAETMMSGLTGSIETFNSKVERLKQITGEALEGDVTYWTDKLGGFVDSVAEMDNASFSGLVGGLEVIAGAGPGLLVAGSAFRLIGFALGTHAGRIALGALAIGALTKAINDYNEAKFEDKFGDLKLDMEPIRQHLQEVTAPFKEARTDIDAYVESMNTAVQAYTDKSSELASGIISKMVTGAELTEEEKQSFMTLGDDIGKAIIDGIGSSYDTVAESYTQAAGGLEKAVNDPTWQKIMGILELGYGEAIGRAEDLSKNLREALTSGFADGHLTGEEVENIQSILDEMNELLAIQTAAENYAESQRLMRKAQTLGLEGLGELTSEVNATRDSEVEAIQGDRDRTYGLVRAYLEAHMGEYYTDAEGIEHLIDEDYIKKTTAEATKGYEDLITERMGVYDSIIMAAYENAMHTSELGDANQLADDLVADMLAGNMTADEAVTQALQSGYLNDMGQAQKYWGEEIAALGGFDAIDNLIAQYRDRGNDAEANRLAGLLLKYDLYTDTRQQQFNSTNGYQSNASLGPIMTGARLESYGIEQPGFGPANVPVEIEGAESAASEARGTMEGILSPAIEMQAIINNATSAAETARATIVSILSGIEVGVSVHGGISGGLGGAKMAAFADGGRSTEPAIFAEAGDPEWFIPERHDPNTARLIAAAAHASGFSLAELAAMNGARMFADGGVFGGSSVEDSAVLNWASLDYGGKEERSGSGTTFDVHYAPVIHAQNAEGVGRELAEDKKRLKKLLRELSEEEELYESVVRY